MSVGLDISAPHLREVQEILRQYAPVHAQVWVFGSRAKGTAKRASDLDLALDVHRPLTHAELTVLQDAFAASNLPYTVDILDWQSAAPAIKQMIAGDLVAMPDLLP